MPPTPTQGARFLTVTGVLLPDNTFLRDPGFLTDQGTAEDTDGAMLVEMIGYEGRLLLRRRLTLEEACTDGARTGIRLVTATVPAPAATEAIRFSVDSVVVEEFRVPSSEPRLEAPVVEPRRRGAWRVTWAATHEEEVRLAYAVGFSHDGGATWHPIGLPTQEPEAELDVDSLPGGKRCTVVVMATDGFHTVTRRSRPFALPVSACLAMILAPEEGTRLRLRAPLRLQGQGYWREEGTPELELLEWTSSQDGLLGRGPIVEVESPSVGEHEITLVAGTGDRAGRATTTVLVGDLPLPRRRRRSS